MSSELGMMNTLLLQVDCMETKSDKCSLVAYLRGDKKKGRRHLYLEERKRQHVTRERKQIDRKSHCDSKQSQITLLCLSWHIIVWPSRTLVHTDPPFSIGQGDTNSQ